MIKKQNSVSPFTVKDRIDKEPKDTTTTNEVKMQPTKTLNYPNINTISTNTSVFPKKLETKNLSSNLLNSLKLKNYNKNKTSANYNKKLNKIKETPIFPNEVTQPLTSIKSHNKLYTNSGLLKTEQGLDFEFKNYEKTKGDTITNLKVKRNYNFRMMKYR